ncbi:MAG: hypothetical protein M0P57_02950 [Syntrophales bacterium]|jgi:hypothetical protein|nr:hypothetical protein [Syntrophales bacterium]MDY0045392.1 hypothetical protein [Syntrophales bacterium]
MGIWRAAIDTGGGRNEEQEISRTEEVYQYLKRFYLNTDTANDYVKQILAEQKKWDSRMTEKNKDISELLTLFNGFVDNSRILSSI